MHVIKVSPGNSTLARSTRLAAPRSLLPTAAVTASAWTRSRVPTRCQARRTTATKGRGTVKTRKGFGPGPVKQQEPWEAQLLSCYKVYYKPSFKPPRYLGPIELHKFPDGSMGVIADSQVSGAELLLVSHPMEFLNGSMGSAPAVEDLHVYLLEKPPNPIRNKIFSYLPRRPLPAAAAAGGPEAAEPAELLLPAETVPVVEPLQQGAAAAAPPHSAAEAADAVDAASAKQQQQHGQQEKQQQQQQRRDPDAPQAPPSLAHLMPTFWEQVGPTGYANQEPLSSRQLMRMLQVSTWSEEFQDPAACQVRHERPQGFIGLWPELAFFRHSCVPSASAVVVGGNLLMHATADAEPGAEFTFNKLGSAVAAPVGVRQAAHMDLFGRPCCCRRCSLEQQLPAETIEQLQAVYDASQGDWPRRLQAALEGSGVEGQEEASAEALAELQVEVAEELIALDEALAPALPDKEERLLALCSVYNAYDLSWQMEELLSEPADLNKLANCVSMLRLFAPGSENHVYACMILDQAYNMKAREMQAAAQKMSRKTAAQQRRLTAQINQLLQEGEAAALAYLEAVSCRYGILPQEGLLPNLEQGLSMFYAGLDALSAAQGGDGQEVPQITRNLDIDGIPVTVVDTVEGAAFAGAPGEDDAELVEQAGQRLKIKMIED